MPSSAGAGAPAANSTSPMNPLQARGMIQTPPAGKPAMPSADNPFGGAEQMMNGSMPLKGGTFLEKALVKRMSLYPPA